MRFGAAALPLFLAEEAQFYIGIPITVPNPTPKEMYHAWEFVTGDIFATVGVEFSEDFVAQGRGDFFIGIEKQDPFLACDIFGEILLPDVSEPAMLIHSVRVFAADLDGTVGAETVDDDNLITPLDAFQATSYVSLFIARSNAGGDPFSHNSPSIG